MCKISQFYIVFTKRVLEVAVFPLLVYKIACKDRYEFQKCAYVRDSNTRDYLLCVGLSETRLLLCILQAVKMK